MEDLISQFNILSDQALRDKSFDPSTIQDLMKLFETEAQNSWSSMESDFEKEFQDAQTAMDEAESELEAAMESAMDEYRRFDNVGDAAWKVGQVWEKVATASANKYVDSAVKSASNGISSARVHPS